MMYEVFIDQLIIDHKMHITMLPDNLNLLIETAGPVVSDDYRFWPNREDIIEHLETHHNPDHWGWYVHYHETGYAGRVKFSTVLWFKDPAIASYFKLLWSGR